MTAWADAVALLITAAGVVSALAVLLATRRPWTAAPVLLDMLLAAGLLRLLGEVTWQRIASAALLVTIRHIATAGIGLGRRARTSPPGPGRLTPPAPGR